MTETSATEHLDRLASKYAGRQIRLFGDSIPAGFAETPVLCLIKPSQRHGDRCDGRKGMTAILAPETVPIQPRTSAC